MIRPAVFCGMTLLLAQAAFAHHGGGTFDSTKEIRLTGTFTRLDLVNPHSWIYFEVTGPDGKVASYRCEMRSATVLRRSGWKPEMFRRGERLTFEGSPDRNDPNSCYLNTIVFEDGKRVDRYGQLTQATKAPLAAGTRALRRPNGDPNISGDWAPEQLVMTDPRGRGGALVPLGTVDKYKPGEGRIGGPRGAGRGGPRVVQGAELTEAGEKGAERFATLFSKDNPRMRCETARTTIRRTSGSFSVTTSPPFPARGRSSDRSWPPSSGFSRGSSGCSSASCWRGPCMTSRRWWRRCAETDGHSQTSRGMKSAPWPVSPALSPSSLSWSSLWRASASQSSTPCATVHGGHSRSR